MRDMGPTLAELEQLRQENERVHESEIELLKENEQLRKTLEKYENALKEIYESGKIGKDFISETGAIAAEALGLD